MAGCQHFNILNGPLEFLLQLFCFLRRILCQFWKKKNQTNQFPTPHSLGIKVWKSESTLFPKEDALGIWISNVCLNPCQKSVLKQEQEILKSVSVTTATVLAKNSSEHLHWFYVCNGNNLWSSGCYLIHPQQSVVFLPTKAVFLQFLAESNQKSNGSK